MPEVTFSTFILSLASSALVHLGEVPNPETGSTETSLHLAKHSIDVLEMLHMKTERCLDDQERKLLESILFAAGEPVSAADTADALGITRETLDSCADRLEESYRSSERGIRLVRTEDRYSLSTKPENYPQIAAVLGRSRRRTLTRASAEVLAVVAYRQPVTRVDVDQIRGVGSAGSIQKLLDSDLI